MVAQNDPPRRLRSVRWALQGSCIVGLCGKSAAVLELAGTMLCCVQKTGCVPKSSSSGALTSLPSHTAAVKGRFYAARIVRRQPAVSWGRCR